MFDVFGSGSRPSRDEIEAALERVLLDREFLVSTQRSLFLRYVVKQTLDGRANHIKAYSIAVDAFGLPSDFNPQTHSIVRVSAARLRKSLKNYYTNAGLVETIEIELASGSYIPTFRYRPTGTPNSISPFKATTRWLARQPPETRALYVVLVCSIIFVSLVAFIIEADHMRHAGTLLIMMGRLYNRDISADI